MSALAFFAEEEPRIRGITLPIACLSLLIFEWVSVPIRKPGDRIIFRRVQMLSDSLNSVFEFCYSSANPEKYSEVLVVVWFMQRETHLIVCPK